MSLGSDSPGGSPEGIGGDESGIGSNDSSSKDSSRGFGGFQGLGIGNPTSYGGISTTSHPGGYSDKDLAEFAMTNYTDLPPDLVARAYSVQQGLAQMPQHDEASIKAAMDNFIDHKPSTQAALADKVASLNEMDKVSDMSLSDMYGYYSQMKSWGQPTKDIFGGAIQSYAEGILDMSAKTALGGLFGEDLAGKMTEGIGGWGVDMGNRQYTDKAFATGDLSPLEGYSEFGGLTGEKGKTLLSEINSLLDSLTRPSSVV